MGRRSLFAIILAAVHPPVASTFFAPAKQAPEGTPVVVWGGSSPGRPTALAQRLAAAGNPALALAYFGEPGLPPELERIRLEYFAEAVRELDRQPGVDGRKIVVYGNSRGSESALLVGAHFPEIVHGVIATAPSSKAYSAVKNGRISAWTLHGKDIPYALADDALAGFDAPSVIPVERIHGPILLGSGAEDQLYDSKAYARAIVRRLRRHDFAYPVRSVVFAHTGHSVSDKLLPATLRFLRRSAAPAAGSRPARTGPRARRPARARRRR